MLDLTRHLIRGFSLVAVRVAGTEAGCYRRSQAVNSTNYEPENVGELGGVVPAGPIGTPNDGGPSAEHMPSKEDQVPVLFTACNLHLL